MTALGFIVAVLVLQGFVEPCGELIERCGFAVEFYEPFVASA